MTRPRTKTPFLTALGALFVAAFFVAALPATPTAADEIVDGLVEVAGDRAQPTAARTAAVRSLRAIDSPETYAALITLGGSYASEGAAGPDALVSATALAGLTDRPGEGRDATVVAALAAEFPVVRRAAAFVAGHGRIVSAFPGVLDLIETTEDAGARIFALHAAGSIGGSEGALLAEALHARAVAVGTAILADDARDRFEKHAATLLLGELRADAAVPRLIGFLVAAPFTQPAGEGGVDESAAPPRDEGNEPTTVAELAVAVARDQILFDRATKLLAGYGPSVYVEVADALVVNPELATDGTPEFGRAYAGFKAYCRQVGAPVLTRLIGSLAEAAPILVLAARAVLTEFLREDPAAFKELSASAEDGLASLQASRVLVLLDVANEVYAPEVIGAAPPAYDDVPDPVWVSLVGPLLDSAADSSTEIRHAAATLLGHIANSFGRDAVAVSLSLTSGDNATLVRLLLDLLATPDDQTLRDIGIDGMRNLLLKAAEVGDGVAGQLRSSFIDSRDAGRLGVAVDAMDLYLIAINKTEAARGVGPTINRQRNEAALDLLGILVADEVDGPTVSRALEVAKRLNNSEPAFGSLQAQYDTSIIQFAESVLDPVGGGARSPFPVARQDAAELLGWIGRSDLTGLNALTTTIATEATRLAEGGLDGPERAAAIQMLRLATDKIADDAINATRVPDGVASALVALYRGTGSRAGETTQRAFEYSAHRLLQSVGQVVRNNNVLAAVEPFLAQRAGDTDEAAARALDGLVTTPAQSRRIVRTLLVSLAGLTASADALAVADQLEGAGLFAPADDIDALRTANGDPAYVIAALTAIQAFDTTNADWLVPLARRVDELLRSAREDIVRAAVDIAEAHELSYGLGDSLRLAYRSWPDLRDRIDTVGAQISRNWETPEVDDADSGR